MKQSLMIAVIFTFLLQVPSFSIPSRPSILVIGDSNMEMGFVTGALQHFFDTTFGYTGSGYSPFNKTCAYPTPYKGFKPDTFARTVGSTFKDYNCHGYGDMYPLPYPSPCCFWIISSMPGDSVTLRFLGGAIDLYWLSKPSGGSFKASIDGEQKIQVATSGTNMQANKTTIKGLDPSLARFHNLKISVVSGEVTLLGFDGAPDSSGNNKRAVVHNWGHGYGTSTRYVNVDSVVFRTALQALNPDAVVIWLGENDAGNEKLDSLTFEKNMETISKRVRNALPKVNIMLVSSHVYVSAAHYLGWSYPTAAARTGAKFWDLYTWIQPHFNEWTQDMNGGHINPTGGVFCAAQLWKVLNDSFPNTAGVEPAKHSPPRGKAHVITKEKPGYYLLNGSKLTSIDLDAAKREHITLGKAPAALLPGFVIVK